MTENFGGFEVPEGHEGHRISLQLGAPPHCLTCGEDIGAIMELKREDRGSYGELPRCGFIEPDDLLDASHRRCREIQGHFGAHDFRSGPERVRDAIEADRGGRPEDALATITAWNEAQRKAMCDQYPVPGVFRCSLARGHEGDCLPMQVFWANEDSRPEAPTSSTRTSWWQRLLGRLRG